MNVLLYGATGMVGQGVARECELDPGVERIVTVGRRPTGRAHPKTREVVQPNLTDLSSIASELPSINACMFCLGVSSLGKSEEEYSKITYDLTLAIAEQLVRANPAMTFIYVSGASTDSTERGRMMWARVKGRTENALLRLPFRAAFMFRPGAILPMHGVRSKVSSLGRLLRAPARRMPGFCARSSPACGRRTPTRTSSRCRG